MPRQLAQQQMTLSDLESRFTKINIVRIALSLRYLSLLLSFRQRALYMLA